MAARSTTVFFNNLQSFQAELAGKVKELRDVAERERPTSTSRRTTRLVWLDELEQLEETLIPQTEFLRSSIRLDLLLSHAEAAADALEDALTRAEDVASIKHGYESASSNTGSSRQTYQKASDSLSPPRRLPTPPKSPLSASNKPAVMALKSGKKKTPKSVRRRVRAFASPALRLSDPPTPRMEDLGLSKTALHLLKGM